jgi:hypothetical protein
MQRVLRHVLPVMLDVPQPMPEMRLRLRLRL